MEYVHGVHPKEAVPASLGWRLEQLHGRLEARHLLAHDRLERTGSQRLAERVHFVHATEDARTQLECLL